MNSTGPSEDRIEYFTDIKNRSELVTKRFAVSALLGVFFIFLGTSIVCTINWLSDIPIEKWNLPAKGV